VATVLKFIAALLTPFMVTAISLYAYGMYVSDEEKIYPNITIAGVDVSGLTRDEAMLALGLPVYEERINNAIVTITFPDDSELIVSGPDAGMWFNAREMVSQAYSIGRGDGVIWDVITYMQRYSEEEVSFDIDYFLDSGALEARTSAFTEHYNRILDASGPVIFTDRVVFTKGVGHVNADADEIFELAYAALFKSIEEEVPIEIIYTLPDTNRFVEELLAVRDKIFVQLMSSEYDIETNSATVSATGVDFDPVEAALLLRETENGKAVTIYFEFLFPEYTQEYLESLLFRDLIGTSRTWVHGNSNRVGNIRLASESINGHVLMPGDEFSFNGVVGRRSTDRGYRSAPALSQGETIQSVGGGVCQVSSTIHAAIRTTGIEVTAQRRHSRSVPYMPWGHDATVFFPYLDFKFVNNTNYPLRLDVELEGRYLEVYVWGTIIDDFPATAEWLYVRRR
jgi:hypothetical protein